MSGGSMDYLYSRVRDASFIENSPRRRAFRAHLNLIADCLRAIEWNDSGDGAGDEDELIEKAIGPQALVRQAMQDALWAKAELEDAIHKLQERIDQ